MRTTNPQRLLAYALIAIGVIMLLSRIGGADWLWLALIGAVFLVGYVSRQNYNFLVAGGVLIGIAVGTLIDTDSGMLLGLAAGFFAIDRVEPRPNRWALYGAGIFAVLGALVALGSFGLLSSVAFAVVLVAAGAYLLYREGGKPDTPRPTASASTTSTYTPAAAAEPSPAAAPPTPPAPDPSGTRGTDTDKVNPTVPPAYVPPVTEAPGASESLSESQINTASSTGEAANEAANETTADTSAPVTEQPPAQTVLSEEAETRLGRLEAWRRETAKTEGVPAYIVFTNDTLSKVAAANPQTLDELVLVKGVGPIKRSRYGEAVLNVLQNVDGPSSPENSGPEAAS